MTSPIVLVVSFVVGCVSGVLLMLYITRPRSTFHEPAPASRVRRVTDTEVSQFYEPQTDREKFNEAKTVDDLLIK